MLRSALVFFASAISLPALGACGGSPTILPVKDAAKKCEVQVVSLSVIASPVINPTGEGEPRPVTFRIYQLKDDVKLQASTFEQIWKDDAATLGQGIVKKDELFVYPSSRTDVKFERDPAAGNVVGAALFQNPKGRSWYVSFELPPPPGKGDCYITGACEDGKCGPNLNPKFSMWVDAARVDDGADHLGDVTDGRRIRVVTLSKPVPEAPAADKTGGDKGAEKKP